MPVLVGPEAKIRAVAADAKLDITEYHLVATPHSHAAAAEAVAMAGRGEVEALMKGSLHTDELMHAVVTDKAMATGRRISHCYLFDVAAYPRPLFITDAAINIFPSLSEKQDICQNAIDFAVAMGVVVPKVAILSAVETGDAKKCPPRLTPPLCARWRSAARSPAVCWTGRWPSTMPSAWRRRGSRALSRRSRGRPTSCWCPISNPATCWPSS